MWERSYISRTASGLSGFQNAPSAGNHGESRRGFPGNTRCAIRSPDSIAASHALAGTSRSFGHCAIPGGQHRLPTGCFSDVRMPALPGDAPKGSKSSGNKGGQRGRQGQTTVIASILPSELGVLIW